MTSNAPDKCCVVGVKRGALLVEELRETLEHEGSTVGQLDSIAGVPAYISDTPDGSKKCGIVLLPDVFGHEYKNTQLVADQFAANGYFTVVPDLFQGDAVPIQRPANFELSKWLQGPPSKQADAVDPIVTNVVRAMREKGCSQLGAVGYCFGAKYVVRFLGDAGSKNNALVDAGYVAHPSLVEDEELRAIQGPLSIAAAETDSIFPAEKRHKTEEILEELSKGKAEIPYEITLFAGVEHGFAIKGDVKRPRVRFAKEKAFIQAIQFFQFHLEGSNLN